jgi:hypothetical protein
MATSSSVTAAGSAPMPISAAMAEIVRASSTSLLVRPPASWVVSRTWSRG